MKSKLPPKKSKKKKWLSTRQVEAEIINVDNKVHDDELDDVPPLPPPLSLLLPQAVSASPQLPVTTVPI